MESTAQPNYRILIRDKKGCFALNPFKSKTTKLFSLEECTSIFLSKNHIAILNKGHLSLYHTSDYSLAKSFSDLQLVAAVDFSPKEKFFCVIQKPSIKDNLKILSLSDYSIVYTFQSLTNPTTQWPQISYDVNEELIFLHIKTTINIFKTDLNTKNLIQFGSFENVFAFDIAQYKENENNKNIILLGKSFPTGKNSRKCFFSLYDLNDISKPYKEMNISLTDRMKIKLSQDRKIALINAINDSTSSQSYYGGSALYYSDISSGKFNKFSLPEGPIHDFNWCSNGDFFAICAGHLPSKTSLYSKEGKLIKEICTGKFNKLYISPDSRLIALCGFASLNGDIEIYNLETYQIIGKANFFCCSNFQWSRDSKFILGSVLWARVKVDNEYRIMKYNGEEVVVQKDGSEVHDCLWMYDENEKYEKFKIEVNEKSLQKKEKKGMVLTSTLGTINFGSGKGDGKDTEGGGIVGLGKKKKKKK